MSNKPFAEQVAIITGGGTETGANIRVFNLCPGLVDVDHTGEMEAPRAGAIHVRNMARTLMFALTLDRDVDVEDINIYARG